MTTVHRRSKPLSVSPLKASQTIGAALAFLGVERAVPLMHGAPGVYGVRQGLLRPPFPRADPAANDGDGSGQLGHGCGREHRRGAAGRVQQAVPQPGRTADDRPGGDPGGRHSRGGPSRLPRSLSGVHAAITVRPGQHAGLLRLFRVGLRRRRPRDDRCARAGNASRAGPRGPCRDADGSTSWPGRC